MAGVREPGIAKSCARELRAELRQNCARGAPVCCASSLPYETEWMSGDDAFEVISFAQSSSEYWFE